MQFLDAIVWLRDDVMIWKNTREEAHRVVGGVIIRVCFRLRYLLLELDQKEFVICTYMYNSGRTDEGRQYKICLSLEIIT